MPKDRRVTISHQLRGSSEEKGEMLASLEQQRVALYDKKQCAASEGAGSAAMQETITSLEAQLVELFRDKEESARAA